MTDSLVTTADPSVRLAAKSKKVRRQQIGRSAVYTMHGIMKNAKVHDHDNEIFDEPLRILHDAVHGAIDMDGMFEFYAVGTMTVLNTQLLKLDFQQLEHIRMMTTAFKARGVGGISIGRPIDISELRSFFRALGGEGPLEEGADGVRNIRIVSHPIVVRELQKRSDNELAKYSRVDRRGYALTIYARAVHLMKMYIEKLSTGEQPSMSRLLAIARELVDLAYGQSSDFLAMAQTRNNEDYLAFHSVNTLLLAVVVGMELKLAREHLVELARGALFHDVGVVLSTEREVVKRNGALSPEERARVAQNPLFAVKLLLKERPLRAGTLKCALVALEAKQPWCRLEKDARGQPRVLANDLSLHGRIVRVASTYDALTSQRPNRPAYSPEVALGMLCGELRHELDPTVLHAFCSVLAR